MTKLRSLQHRKFVDLQDVFYLDTYKRLTVPVASIKEIWFKFSYYKLRLAVDRLQLIVDRLHAKFLSFRTKRDFRCPDLQLLIGTRAKRGQDGWTAWLAPCSVIQL